jgi:hypothetical protein
MLAGLNRTWDVEARDLPWLSLKRARAASLGLVAPFGAMAARPEDRHVPAHGESEHIN